MGLVFRDTKEWRGEWSNIELYYLDNLVRRNGSVYLCLAPHIGQEPPLDGGVYWDLYAEKGDPGTNGTDGTDGSDGVVQAIVAGSNISVDNTDPANPVVSASGSLGLTSVNGESGPAITIALGTTAQTNDLGIVVATNTITLHIPNASATDRGVITAGTQTFGGAKTFASPLTVSGSSGYISVGSNDWRFRDNGGSACVIQVGSTTTTAFTASSSGTNTFLGHLAFGNTQASPHIILRGAAANTLQCGSATNFTIRPSNNSGTDAAAYNMTIAPGASTGAATPATLAFQSSAAIGSGSTLQTMVNTLTVANRRVTVTSGSSLYVADKAASAGQTWPLTIDDTGLVSSSNLLASYATIAYADSLVVGLLDDRGNHDASSNLFPSSGGSGSAGAILKGDLWTISVGGTLGGVAVTPGDIVRALVDTPGTTASNWAISETNIGYTPLNASLSSGQIYVGNGSNVGTAVTVSGDITISNTGVATIAAGAVDIAMLSASGTPDSTTFLRGDNTFAVPVDATKLPLAGGTMTGTLTTDTAGTSDESIIIPHGSAPSSPTNGSIWTTTTGVFARQNGVTHKIGGETRSITLTIDGSGSAITTGVKTYLEIPYDCTIEEWNIVADQSGSIVIDVWKDTYANFPPTVADTIAGTEKPTLSAAQKNQDLSLSSWTTTLSKGDWLAFNVDSASTVTKVVLTLKVRLR